MAENRSATTADMLILVSQADENESRPPGRLLRSTDCETLGVRCRINQCIDGSDIANEKLFAFRMVNRSLAFTSC